MYISIEKGILIKKEFSKIITENVQEEEVYDALKKIEIVPLGANEFCAVVK